MQIFNWNQLGEQARKRLLQRPALRMGAEIEATVGSIRDQVRAGGDAVLLELTKRFDGAALERLEVSEDEFEEAQASLSAPAREALLTAIANVERFHAAQLPAEIDMETAPGVRCRRVNRPIPAVGLYVPAGSAPLPSAAVMLAVPARLAGNPQRVMCTPPGRDGRINAAVLVAAQLCGVQRVFKIGGAQAVIAMAYGSESVPKVDKIFGPGNAWVTAAKSLVARDPEGAALDMPAGPSEVMVIADESASAEFVASDLLSQAEHGPDSQVLLVTTSSRLAEQVAAVLPRFTASLSRAGTIEAALAHSAVIVVPEIGTAVDISNLYAPEHLILQIANAAQWSERIYAAGSVFLGRWTPESVGDYCSGTNHVLPTYGFARSYSGLGVGDFLRCMTVQELTGEGLARIGPVAQTLSELEGLDAHTLAVSIRLDAYGRS